MSCIIFFRKQFIHVSHGLVVRVLASGAGGPGSNLGGVTCGMEGRTMETMDHACCYKSV
jgi:hypothetical protein